jgi:hypothetical protein
MAHRIVLQAEAEAVVDEEDNGKLYFVKNFYLQKMFLTFIIKLRIVCELVDISLKIELWGSYFITPY